MERFNGLSGKFYIENSFGNGKYDYAVYESEKDFYERTHLPDYVDAKTAFSDFKETKLEVGYLFTIDTGSSIFKINTTVNGKIRNEDLKDELFKDYLIELQMKYGRENVTYQTEKIN